MSAAADSQVAVNAALADAAEFAAQTACGDWAASGAMALTGAADGAASGVRGAPTAVLRAALAVLQASISTAVSFPGVGLLGERAALMGLTRNAPLSAGGAFRILPTSDGWCGISLARDSDVASVPALIEAEVDAPWSSLASWLLKTSTTDAVARARLLDFAVAAVPPARLELRRPPVLVTEQSTRPIQTRAPLVVDLTALWAGPLAAHLLALSGARVIKVEAMNRPDGARSGSRAFYDLLNSGHESVALNFADEDDLALLRALISAADVVLEASRPRAVARLGIDAAQYAREGAVWVSITAYGRSLPDGDRIGFGDDVAAGAGLVYDGPHGPGPAGDALADPLTGAVAAATAAFALSHGHAGLFDVSMHDVARWAASIVPGDSALVGAEAPPTPRNPLGTAAELGAHTLTVRHEFGAS